MMWWGLTVCGVCYMYNVCDVARSYRMWYGVVLHVRGVVLHVQCV